MEREAQQSVQPRILEWILLGQRLGEWSATYGSEAKKKKVYVTINFYDYNGRFLESKKVYFVLPKGTKKNWTTTAEVKGPTSAVYYDFY